MPVRDARRDAARRRDAFGVQGDDIAADENDLWPPRRDLRAAAILPDEPSANIPAGDVAAMLVRCAEAIKDVDVEMRLPGDDWTPVAEVASTPVLNDELFPSAI